MTSPPLSLLLGAAALSAACTWILARLAPRLGWVDAGDGARKQQRVPLATVGGAAIALALLALWPLLPALGASSLVSSPWKGAALIAALAVGLVDDRVPGGLRPRTKLAGQALAGLVLAIPVLARAPGDGASVLLALGLIVGAVVAQNAWNTFDNADGAAAGLALLGLAPVAPLAAAAVAGFLPFNLGRRGGRALLAGLPRAILGDAGSHLLGMAVFVTPLAWPVFALPLFDIARVALERLQSGQAPWVGDRRHLAHRLERSGASPVQAAGILACVAAPSALLGWTAGSFSTPLALGGVLVTLVGFALCVRLTRTQSEQVPESGEASPLSLRS